MSRDNLPKRPSDYQMPVFMNEVPEDADEEAGEMALRNGVDEPRVAKAKAKAKPKPKPKPAPAAEPATEPAAEAKPAAKAEPTAEPEPAAEPEKSEPES